MRIQCKEVSYIYQKGTPFEEIAADKLSFSIPAHSFVSVLGKTGSGKTTALQLVKGLLKPSAGEILYYEEGNNHTLNQDTIKQDANNQDQPLQYTAAKQSKEDRKKLEKLWNQVGYLFQYPEHQLFEETVEADVSYGPKNLKFSSEETNKAVKEAMEFVGLDYTDFATRSPFNLSGGQMRRVALAGILALKPKIMILDEPMAGLDPLSKVQLTSMIYRLHKQLAWTTMCVSHHIDELWQYTDYYVVFENKKVIFSGAKKELLFLWQEKKIDIDPPSIIKLALLLQSKGILKKDLTDMDPVLQTEASFATYLRRELC